MCHLIGVPLYAFLYIEGEWCALSQKKVFYSDTNVSHFFVSIIPVKDWTHVKIYMIPFVLKWWRAKRHLLHLVCPLWKYSTVFIWVQLIKCRYMHFYIMNVSGVHFHKRKCFTLIQMFPIFCFYNTSKRLHSCKDLNNSICFKMTKGEKAHAPSGVPFMKILHYIYLGATNKMQC